MHRRDRDRLDSTGAILISLVALALAADPAPSARPVSLEAGLGLGLLAGGNGSGYGLGGSERFGVDVPAGRTHSVIIAAEHAHHVLANSRAYLPDETVPEDAIEGGRDRWEIGIGGRFQLQLADPAADRVLVEPLAEVGMALVVTHTTVVMSGFDGRTTLGSWDVAPGLALGLGADVRIRRFFALVPALRVAIALEDDPPETGGESIFGAEAHGGLSCSARVAF